MKKLVTKKLVKSLRRFKLRRKQALKLSKTRRMISKSKTITSLLNALNAKDLRSTRKEILARDAKELD
jgi:hypothetical protein